MTKSSLLTLGSKPKAMLTAATISLLALSQSAEAVVTWWVADTPGGMVMRTGGSLRVSGTGTVKDDVAVRLFWDAVQHAPGGQYAIGDAGVASVLPNMWSVSNGVGTGDAFGHDNSYLQWDLALGASPSLIAPSTTMTFNGVTVWEVWGGSLDSGPILAWTHGVTGDTIQIALVPESSSTALLGLGGLALILRRRR